MDAFSQFNDPLPYGSIPHFVDKPETSSLSDASTVQRASHSDEEVLLATSRPKKRAGRKVFKETRHPIFRGVRMRNNNKWVCELREPNKQTRIWLGTYPTPEMAARAHDAAALALKGKSACLNFADSTWRLRVPASTDTKVIRKAAAEAAESFRPQEYEEICDSEVRQEESTNASSNDDYGGLRDKVEEAKTSKENTFWPENSFIDEEAVFDMPGLLVNMAQGLLVSPPPLPFEDDIDWDDFESVSLWSHSI